MELTYIKISNYINKFIMLLKDICLWIKPYQPNKYIIKGHKSITYDLS